LNQRLRELEDDPVLFNNIDFKALKEMAEKQLAGDESSEDVVSTRSHPREMDLSYKNKAYWQLPENVRNAIDLAKIKSQHSEFYYKL